MVDIAFKYNKWLRPRLKYIDYSALPYYLITLFAICRMLNNTRQLSYIIQFSTCTILHSHGSVQVLQKLVRVGGLHLSYLALACFITDVIAYIYEWISIQDFHNIWHSSAPACVYYQIFSTLVVFYQILTKLPQLSILFLFPLVELLCIQ